MHELLHTLGFNHSINPDNILYPISKCSQTLGDDVPKLIDELYSYPNYPDVVFEDVSVAMEGKYLNANISMRNEGLDQSGQIILTIYADNKVIKKINVDSLNIGYGTKLSLLNVWINKLSFDELKFVLEIESEELDKSNNEIIFTSKS